MSPICSTVRRRYLDKKNNNLITRINYRSQQRAIVNQNEENRNPDIVVSIHQKKLISMFWR